MASSGLITCFTHPPIFLLFPLWEQHQTRLSGSLEETKLATVSAKFCISFVVTDDLLLWAAAHLARTPAGDGRLLVALQNASGFRA